MSLRTRVLLLVGAAVGVTLLLGVQLSLVYTEAKRTVDLVIEKLGPAGIAVADLATATNNMDRRLRIYVSSGDEGYRVLYDAAVTTAERSMNDISRLLGGDPAYAPYTAEVAESLDRWLAEVGVPTRSEMESDNASAAQDILDSTQSQTSYIALTADTYRLTTLLGSAEQEALSDGGSAAQRLAWALIAALAVLLAIPLLSLWVLWHSVLRPVAKLRVQLRRTATPGSHDSVITAGGPPEIRDLGSDAEALRRALVREIDQAQAAQTALEQEGPVVDAIRRELTARTDPGPPGMTVTGILRPAEGVLAGDFWDRIPMTDGRMAAIVCDVSGHGPRAGIVAMRLKTAITLGLIAGQELPEILHRSCDAFADEPARFATAVILVADPRTGALEWVNAGHPAPRIVRGGTSLDRLAPTGPMVSWLIGTWRVGRTVLGPDDVCVAFTDGVLESRDDSGEELGDEGLDARVLAAAAVSVDPVEMIQHTLAGVRERSADLGRDDVTMVALRAQPRSGRIPEQRG